MQCYAITYILCMVQDNTYQSATQLYIFSPQFLYQSTH